MPSFRSARIQSLTTSTVFRTTAFRPFVAAGLGVVWLLLGATAASAEPFAITSGSFAFRWDSSVPVEVSGPAFKVTNADTNPEDFGLPGLAMEHAQPSAATLPVSGRINLNLSARLILTGQPEPEGGGPVLFDLVFTGPSAVSHPVTEACPGCPVIVAAAPFRLTGVLTAGLFRNDVVGRGTATVGFFREFGTDTLRPFATYDFAPAAPVPEPGSLTLLATGAAWLARRKRRADNPSL